MEHKFRYWDPFNGCMKYSKDFENLVEFFIDYQLMIDGENEPELEFFAQRQDIEGNDLYENDLIRCRMDGTEQQNPILVFFKGGGFEPWQEGEFDSYYSVSYERLVGNIHQNPDIVYDN